MKEKENTLSLDDNISKNAETNQIWILNDSIMDVKFWPTSSVSLTDYIHIHFKVLEP